MSLIATNSVLIQRFQALRAWSRGDERAVHKPLLVLYAIGQAGRSADRLLPFHQVDRDLGALLKEFGPPRRTVHTEYPFWRLQNDGIWEVAKADTLRRRESNSDPIKSELLAKDIHGGFLPECFSLLRRSAETRDKIVQGLLHAHFPESIHSDILSAIGLSKGLTDYAIEKRSQQFRKDVLRVYNYRCCVCGYDLRLGNQFIGLEAAHIKWFQAGGPDDVENGLSLCVLHINYLTSERLRWTHSARSLFAAKSSATRRAPSGCSTSTVHKLHRPSIRITHQNPTISRGT